MIVTPQTKYGGTDPGRRSKWKEHEGDLRIIIFPFLNIYFYNLQVLVPLSS